MVEVRNVEVFGLKRAQRAVSNSYSAGEINTTDGVTPMAASGLGGNLEAHQSHDAFLKGITVMFDLHYPIAFTPELQRYHFLEIVMSQSTMHSLDKMLTMTQVGGFNPYSKYVTQKTKRIVAKLYESYRQAVIMLQNAKKQDSHIPEEVAFLESNVYECFMKLRHNIPCGFELWETVSTNYLQLKTICIQRANHKMREDWNAFIRACLRMEGFTELTGLSESKLGLKDYVYYNR